MIITCEKCYTKFNLDENLLKQTGSKVRCSKCQNIFLAYPPTEMERPAELDEEIIEFETIDSDVGAESVEQVEVSEEKAKEAFEAEEEEFDLSDLKLEEKIQPEPEAEPEAEPEIEKELEELPELELEIEPVAEETPEETEEALEIEEEELDLSDIEEKPKPEIRVKEETEELELDIEPVIEETPEKAEEAFEADEDKIELSSLDLKEELEPEAEAKEAPEEPEAEAKEAPEEPVVEAKEAPEEPVVEAKEAPEEPDLKKTPPRKKRISTPVLVALIIALLIGGIYGTYVALKSMNIKIPFISDLVEPAVQDEKGNLKIIAFDITDKFIDNSKSGKLFVISGKVKNGYSGTRSFIRVTGKLYTKERALSKTATVYCGNVLSGQDLSNMDINSINRRLLNRFGDNKSNVNVNPGKLLQFMMVFPDIPDNIKEYTIEVAGSSPA